MKKLLGILILSFLAVGWLCSQSVTVTKPAGGETWIKGTAQAITWTKAGTMPNTVRISLRDPSTTNEILLIQDNVSNTGSFLWQIPASVANGSYIIRVKVKDTEIRDDSNAFNIASNAPQTSSITVTKPAAGEKWIRTKPYTITWTKNGSMPNEARIRLMDKNAVNVVREITTQTANTGSYSWTVPADIPFGEYKIRVKIEDVSISDDSDTFEIAKARFIPGRELEEKPLTPVTPAIPVLWKETTIPGIFKNWFHLVKSWDSIPPSSDLYIGRPNAYPTNIDQNKYAHVKYDYFKFVDPKHQNIVFWLTLIHRSQITFALGEFQGQQGKLISAKMHVKQVASLLKNVSCASCATGLFYFLAPCVDWENPSISGQGIGMPPYLKADYDIDITPTVKKWLDGSLANNGLLMKSREVTWGQQEMLCDSVFDISLTLRFSK